MGKRIINFIASGLGISYIPLYLFKREGKYKGCGFFGTILALIFLPFVPIKNIYFVFIFTLFSVYISHKAFKETDEKDNPLIVIDEICGLWWCFLFFEKNIFNSVLLFVLFRIFDTVKIWPIKKIENIKYKGLAIVLDDVVSAWYASFSFFLFKSLL